MKYLWIGFCCLCSPPPPIPILIRGDSFLVFNLEMLIWLKTSCMGFLWGLGQRSFLLEKTFTCYFRHQGASPHQEHFKLNPWHAALFLWHSRINLDYESLWGPASGYEFSREFTYFFPSTQWQIHNRHVSLFSFFVWQDYFFSNSVVLYLCGDFLFSMLWTSFKEES